VAVAGWQWLGGSGWGWQWLGGSGWVAVAGWQWLGGSGCGCGLGFESGSGCFDTGCGCFDTGSGCSIVDFWLTKKKIIFEKKKKKLPFPLYLCQKSANPIKNYTIRTGVFVRFQCT
jgi:hypothetical protein